MLYLFDLDGTLIDQSTCVLLKGVHEWLEKNKLASMAVCSNQGGLGLRHWMEVGGFGNPISYPNHAKIAQKFEWFFQQLPREVNMGVYMCYAYQSPKSKAWSPIPEGEENNPFWRADWRKPAPGMLLRALQDFECKPEEAIFVGNAPEDMQAALAANISYMDADQFFNRI